MSDTAYVCLTLILLAASVSACLFTLTGAFIYHQARVGKSPMPAVPTLAKIIGTKRDETGQNETETAKPQRMRA